MKWKENPGLISLQSGGLLLFLILFHFCYCFLQKYILRDRIPKNSSSRGMFLVKILLVERIAITLKFLKKKTILFHKKPVSMFTLGLNSLSENHFEF